MSKKPNKDERDIGAELSEVVLASRACCLPYSHPRHRPPTGHEFQSLIAIGG